MTGLPAPVLLLAATITVLPDGTGDHPTIQAAVNAATSGDTILLGDGTFTGTGNRDVRWEGKDLHVRSASGNPAACVIDCESIFNPCSGRIGFSFHSAGVSGSSLAGFTVANAGCSLVARGAITCKGGASPRLENLVIRGHQYSGIWCDSGSSPEILNVEIRDGTTPAILALGTGSTPLIRGCVIEANTGPTTSIYGVINLGATSLETTVENCRIVGNSGHVHGGIELGGSAVIRGCLIAGNFGFHGGGIHVRSGATVTIEGCTIVENRAQWGGGIRSRSGSTVDISRSIVWGNCASGGGEDAYLDGTVSVACSILDPARVVGTPSLGPDVLAVDPLFCDVLDCVHAPVTGGMYRLSSTSPALAQPCGTMGATGPGCAPTGVRANVRSAAWGAIKSRYR